MNFYSCPVCVNTANIVTETEKFKHKYKTLQELESHLENDHVHSEWLDYIIEDADDPENNYKEELEK